MRPSSKRSKRKGLLAAPIVLTAMFTPACESRIYTNPGPPQTPPTPPTAAEGPTDQPAIPTAAPVVTAAPSASASAAVAELPPVPKDGDGTVHRSADGSCVYIYPRPSMKCPPHALCNPGPPREPLKVKCPPGNGP
jgi:hypothetical protein